MNKSNNNNKDAFFVDDCIWENNKTKEELLDIRKDWGKGSDKIKEFEHS